MAGRNRSRYRRPPQSRPDAAEAARQAQEQAEAARRAQERAVAARRARDQAEAALRAARQAQERAVAARRAQEQADALLALDQAVAAGLARDQAEAALRAARQAQERAVAACRAQEQAEAALRAARQAQEQAEAALRAQERAVAALTAAVAFKAAAQEQAKETLKTSNIAYNTPETIQMDDTAVVQLVLSPSLSSDELKAIITEPGKKESASIPFSRRVEAHLTGSAFKIAALGAEIPREVKQGRVCEWSWEVTPTQSGTQWLFLTIDAVVAIDGKDTAEYEQFFKKAIKVKVTLSQRVASFVGNNWQWLWTVGLVPLGGWLLARVGRKRHGQRIAEVRRPPGGSIGDR